MTLERTDFAVRTGDGVQLRVRTVSSTESTRERAVIVLVHGISAPLEPTYDLSRPGYSFMEELAGRGHRVVAFDHRNFGRSERCSAMSAQPIEGDVGVHSLDDSVEDIRTVVADTRNRYRADRVLLFGSSRGAIQALAYAVRFPSGLSLVVVNNPSEMCYLAGATSGASRDQFRQARSEARRSHNYLFYTADVQRQRWSKLFGADSSVDAELQEAYLASCIATDEEGSARKPPGFRVPTESIPDRQPLVEFRALEVPCLVVDGEEPSDFALACFFDCVPRSIVHRVKIHDTNHFTLRNARRFELANLVDAAATCLSWGDRVRSKTAPR